MILNIIFTSFILFQFSHIYSQELLDTNCKNNTYFDSTFLKCVSCPKNQNPNNLKNSCECDDGFMFKDNLTYSFKLGCENSCSSNEILSIDNETCVTCPGGQQDGMCVCDSGFVIVKTDLDGTILSPMQCKECPDNQYPGPNEDGSSPEKCVSCPNGKKYNKDNIPWVCECNTQDGFTKAGPNCYTDSVIQKQLGEFPESLATRIDYNNVLEDNDNTETSYSIGISETFLYFYTNSAIQCSKYDSVKDCQILANLCVLAQANEKQGVCQYYKKLMSEKKAVDETNYGGWSEDLPWIYYQNSSDFIIYNTTVDIAVSFSRTPTNGEINEMPFYIAKYNLIGDLISINKLTTELLLCPHSKQDGYESLSFGTMYYIECNFNLLDYLNYSEQYLYELFFMDSKGKVFNVPIMIKGFIDENSNQPNLEDNNVFDKKFIKRFFMIDSVSGIIEKNGYLNKNNTSIVQYAKDIELKVLTTKNSAQDIYLPYLIINYAAKTDITLLDGDIYTTITYRTNYEMDTRNVSRVLKILVSLYQIIIIVISIGRIIVWCKYNPMKLNPETYAVYFVLNIILIITKTWAFCMFFFLFAITGYFFIFYKLQDKVFLLIPSPSDSVIPYVGFMVLLYVVTGLLLLYLIEVIIRQSTCDIYFLDWEKGKKLRNDFGKINVWRTLFLCNELNELQTDRYINFDLTFFLFAFLMIGFNIENLARNTPQMTLTNQYSESNFMLKFFLSTFLLFIIGCSQWLIQNLLSRFVPTSILNYTDLLSVSNVSLIMMNSSLHGYYIHGQSPGGLADTTADDLRIILERERFGTAKGRGLVPNDKTQMQSFEIFIPWNFRQQYDGIFSSEVKKEIQERNRMQGLSTQSRFSFMPRALPRSINIKGLELKNRQFQRILKMYLEGIIADSNKNILEMGNIQRFLTIPPVDMTTISTPIFYRDSMLNFQKMLFYGIDIQLLIVEIMFYNLMDWATRNTMGSVALTFILNRIYVSLKKILASRNMSQKTLIDEKFLI